MNDVGGFVLPYLDWNRAELRSGHLPLWNPHNGSGAPHLANGQSRVFSPFSVPFYVLPLRAALVVASYSILMVAGMLAYGLARHLRRSHLAGLVAAVGYTFCGGVLVWLHWGISGAAAFAPGMVWAASAAALAEDGRARRRAVAALAACVALSLVAGHPETTFFGAGAAVVFAGARLAVARPTRLRALAGAGAVAGGVLLGAAVAAVQLLPLLEYIGQSPGLAHHGGGPYYQWRNAVVHLFPLVRGSPGQAPRDLVYDFGLPLNENIAPYVGVALLLLAGVGGVHVVRRRQWPALVFVAGALGWIAYAYNLAELGTLIGHVPVLDLAYPLRATPLWDLSIVVLAALGVDALRPPGGVEDGAASHDAAPARPPPERSPGRPRPWWPGAPACSSPASWHTATSARSSRCCPPVTRPGWRPSPATTSPTWWRRPCLLSPPRPCWPPSRHPVLGGPPAPCCWWPCSRRPASCSASSTPPCPGSWCSPARPRSTPSPR